MIAIMSIQFQALFDGPLALHRDLTPGETLFHAGDRVTTIALVRRGLVHLLRRTGAGSDIILQAAHAGDVLAEASVYSSTYHCSAEAARAATVSLTPLPAFRQALHDSPEMAATWAAHLAHSVQKARMLAEIRTLRTVAERLDAWLGDGRAVPEKGHLQDLAAALGVSREALYRELATRR